MLTCILSRALVVRRQFRQCIFDIQKSGVIRTAYNWFLVEHDDLGLFTPKSIFGGSLDFPSGWGYVPRLASAVTYDHRVQFHMVCSVKSFCFTQSPICSGAPICRDKGPVLVQDLASVFTRLTSILIHDYIAQRSCTWATWLRPPRPRFVPG